ncbi:MAG: universal stress protein [Chitinophagia bacterium]|nr:universal stress protein [Chitinophagia bacterium]
MAGAATLQSPTQMATPMQILIPVDFSDTSARSLRFTYALNRRFTARLQVLHIFDVPITSGDDGEVYLRNYEAYRKSFEDELWDFVNRNKDGQHFDAEVFATSGGHYQGIVAFAKSHRPDLIVVGHKGAGKVARWMFGSVSRYLLTHPPAPVLSIPGNLPDGETGFRKILLAADLSAPLPVAQMAFLKDFAERQQAELGLLHIRVDGEIPAPDEARTVTGLTQALGARLEEHTLGKGEHVADAILSHLRENGYDLLVVRKPTASVSIKGSLYRDDQLTRECEATSVASSAASYAFAGELQTAEAEVLLNASADLLNCLGLDELH